MRGVSSESPSGTIVGGPGGTITDQFGNAWAITHNRQVEIDGRPRRDTANVTLIAYYNRMIWQWVQPLQLWWYTSGFAEPWLPRSGTPTAPFLAGTPDPRVDELITDVTALGGLFNQGLNTVVGAIQNLNQAVNQIPTEIPPDPAIGQLVQALDSFVTTANSLVGRISDKIDAVAVTIEANQAFVIEQLGALQAQQLNFQASQDSNELALNRIVTMLLRLGSPNPTQITSDLSKLKVVGTQATPLATGP